MKSVLTASMIVIASATSMCVAQPLGVGQSVSAASGNGYVAQEVSAGGYVNSISRGISGGSYGNHAMLWTGTATVDLNPAGFTFSAVNDRSANVSVGYAGTASNAQGPVVWRGTVPSALSVPFAYVVGRAQATDGRQVVGYATEGDPERGFGQTHAMLWDLATGTSTDLGVGDTVYGVGGGVQVGTTTGSKGATAGLWRGASNTFVDLHVTGYDVSVATDTNGAIQVGYVGIDVRVRNEARPRDIRFYSAGYWSGTASSFVYLPSPYRHSFALSIKGDTIVGYGNTSDPIGTPRDSHAVAWIGETHEYVDLHALLPADMRTSRAMSVDELGNIAGYGVTSTGAVRSFVWRRTISVEPSANAAP